MDACLRLQHGRIHHFGASFWAMIYNQKRSKAGQVANRFLSPTWEVTNTILVLLVVSMVGFFPKAAYMLGTVLLVPVSIILLLITLRSSFLVLSYWPGVSQRTPYCFGYDGLVCPGAFDQRVAGDGRRLYPGNRGTDHDVV